jgi:nitroimidazol reductase NimA-like FMN-containing flavoprotein (pyridoxamine 5'-phosphate oxidase superfamily)
MSDTDDLATLARSVIDSNRFMTLATADEDGRPWASPVWFAHEGYRHFLWASKPAARHSRNVAVRPEVGVVIFDSHEAGGWKALYISGVAVEVPDEDVDQAVEVYSARSEDQGLPAWTRAEVTADARHRLYRATAEELFMLDTHDERLPVTFE